MRTLFFFTNLFKRRKHERTSLFEKTEFFRCAYSYSKIYLGAKAIVIFQEGKFEISMSYSVMDGVLVRIKRNKPYKILYDYIGGSFFALDGAEQGYAKLTEILNKISQGSNNCHHMDVYDKLEQEVYNYLIEEAFGNKAGDGSVS